MNIINIDTKKAIAIDTILPKNKEKNEIPSKKSRNVKDTNQTKTNMTFIIRAKGYTVL